MVSERRVKVRDMIKEGGQGQINGQGGGWSGREVKVRERSETRSVRRPRSESWLGRV